MNKLKTLILIMTLVFGLNVYAQPPAKTAPTQKAPAKAAKPAVQAAPQAAAKTYQPVKALDVVARPNFYLNKNITIKGKFDKFSTLGLDYKPAMRSSEDYLSFLIQRDDVKDHNIPLSEMKIFIPRKEAEKYIDLNAGDEVEFSGKVFSTALGDVWMDVDKFTVLTTKAKGVNEAKSKK